VKVRSKLIAAASACSLFAGLGAFASVGTAQAAKTATPAASCDAGYSEWFIEGNLQYFYLTANGVGDPVEVTFTPSCWHVPANGETEEISNEAGNCAEFNHNYVRMESCAGNPAEEWTATDYEGGVYFTNEWAFQNTNPVDLMNAAFEDGAAVGLAEGISNNTLWHN
jgi:hypothetical protein